MKRSWWKPGGHPSKQGVPRKPDEAAYGVEAPGAAETPPLPVLEAAKEAPEPKRAVFVVHGMGQQIPYKTLDDVASGLWREDGHHRPAGSNPPDPKAKTVRVGEEQLHRLEMKLKTAAGEREVHIYEGYWAPLTEGGVKLRDVVAFLFRAGWNGARQVLRPFQRWLFGGYFTFPIPVRSPVAIVATLLFVASLVVTDAVILLVGAGLLPLMDRPRWLTHALLADISTTLEMLLTVAAASLVAVGLARIARLLFRGPLLKGVAAFGSLVLGLLLLAVIFTGLALPALFYAHGRPAAKRGEEVWKSLLGAGPVSRFRSGFEDTLFWVCLVAAALWALVTIGKIVHSLWREFRSPRIGRRAWLSLLAVLALAALLVVVLEGARALTLRSLEVLLGEIEPLLKAGLPWAAVLGASIWARGVLVQYVGDVAVYVSSHRLDRFAELRARVFDCVLRRMRAVYRAEEGGVRTYSEVSVVGHSLGSAIAYDVLNQLIVEDLSAASPAAAPGGSLDVVRRTRLLLTFGSPLDKAAYVFGLQGTATTEAREAAAASSQPLILEYGFRPRRWINIFSPWDVIGGPLSLYDAPGTTHERRVRNVRDPEATTPLMAHTEFWKNRALYRLLHRRLT